MRPLLFVLLFVAEIFATTYPDDFNRTDSASIGPNWALPGYALPYDFSIVGNSAVPNNNDLAEYWSANSFNDNQSSAISVTAFAYYSEMGVFVRSTTSATKTRYALRVRGDPIDSIALLRTLSGTDSVMEMVHFTPSAGDSFSLDATGTTITATYNTTQVIQKTDANISSGVSGMLGNGSNVRIDWWRGASSPSCTLSTITRHATLTDTIGNTGKLKHDTTGAVDSTRLAGTWPDSCAVIGDVGDTVAYRFKAKHALAGYEIDVYSCTGTKSTAWDSIAVVGPSVSYSAATDTLNVAMTKDVASSAMADSMTLKSGPAWMSIAKTGGTMGRLSGTPDSVKSYTVNVYAWRKAIKADSGSFALTVASGLRLDSIRPVSGHWLDTVTVYGRNFGATKGSSTIALGDSTPVIVSWSNTQIKFLVNSGLDTGSYDFIVSDGTAADTILAAFHNLGPAAYTVTYNGNGNSGGTVPIDANSYLDGETVTTLTNSGSLTKTGYTFSTWNTAANGTGTNRAPSGTWAIGAANVTLYAKYAVNTYTVTFDKNNAGATGTTAAENYDYGTTANLTANGYSLTGYTFAGWATSAGGAVAYADQASYGPMGAGNVTLYAKWTINTYTVTYNANGGSGTLTDASSPYNYNSIVTVLANTFTKTGYTFVKWNTAANGSGTDYAPAATFSATANTTLYAQWTLAATGTIVSYSPTASKRNSTLTLACTSLMDSGATVRGRINSVYCTLTRWRADTVKMTIPGWAPFGYYWPIIATVSGGDTTSLDTAGTMWRCVPQSGSHGPHPFGF